MTSAAGTSAAEGPADAEGSGQDGAASVTDVQVTEEIVEDALAPLAAEPRAHQSCWVHWWMVAGIIVTAIYGAAAIIRRRRFTRDLRDRLDEVLAEGDQRSDGRHGTADSGRD